MEKMSKLERWNTVLNMKIPDMVPVFPYSTNLVGLSGIPLKEITTNTRLNAKKSVESVLIPLKKFDYDATFGSYNDGYFGFIELGGEVVIPDERYMVVYEKKYPVEKPEDWEKVMKRLPLDPERDGRMPGLLESYNIMSKKVGENTPIMPFGRIGPLAVIRLLRSLQNLVIDMVLNPDFALELIKAANDFYIDFVRRQYEHGANSIAFWTDTFGTELISVDHHNKFVYPFAKEYSNFAMKEFGQKSLMHFHGPLNKPNTYPLLERYMREMSIAAVQLDEKHELAWLKKEVGEKFKVAITSLMNGPGVLLEGPIEEIIKDSKKAIIIAGQGGGLIAAPVCDVPQNVPVEHFKAWVDTTHVYGKYPLDLKLLEEP